MSVRILIPILIAFILTGCHNRQRLQDRPQQEVPALIETPKSLEDKGSYTFSKRGGSNLVESLYEELVTQDAALKRLEDQIDELNKSQQDSTESFSNFNQKIQSYYHIADRDATEIKDSVLSEKIKLLVAGSLAKYNAQVSEHNELLKTIGAKESAIADLHQAVKIVTTLAVIEKYQKGNMSDTRPLRGYVQEQDKTIHMEDKLLNR